jgi:hypothetical protein
MYNQNLASFPVDWRFRKRRKKGEFEMKKIAAVLALSFMIGMPALAGTITFTPLDGDRAHFENGQDLPTSLRFQVGLLDDFSTIDGNFTAISQHVGVNGGPIATFEFGDLPFTLQAVDPSSAFDSAFLISAVDFGPGSALPFANVGIVTVDTKGAAPGVYVLDSLGEIAGSSNEAAIGSVQFTVVPEPATISLLALGALGLLRRRKTA